MSINLHQVGKASFPNLKTPGSGAEDAVSIARELVRGGSFEFSFGDASFIEEAAEHLPFGMPVYVPMLAAHSLGSGLALIERLAKAGLDPVPHIAARGIVSRDELAGFLKTVTTSAGVHRLMLIGGDHAQARGPYVTSMDLLNDSLLQEFGISELGFAGYPEGHPHIDSDTLHAQLVEKLHSARDRGIGTQVVTQFALVPTRIVEFCTRLATDAPDVPVYAGMAGPTRMQQRIHFARYCGVSASLPALGKVGVKLPQARLHAKPSQQLALLAHHNVTHPSSNLVGVHVYGFGGFRKTVHWIHEHGGFARGVQTADSP